MTPQQRADELLADYQERKVMEAIVKVDEQVTFYEQRVAGLLSAIRGVAETFTDHQVVNVWRREIELGRDVLSVILDKAEGKLK